jgi:tRNA-2-methylthio-N6-dimethylallyladenosine synthase
VKDARLAELQALLAAQQEAFNTATVGKIIPVLFEKPGRHAGQLVGRSPWLQSVHATAPADLVGEIVPVRIAGTRRNSLAGILASDEATKECA